MKRYLLSVLLVLFFLSGSAFAEGDYVEFQRILDSKCSQCHTRVRIEQAMRRGENFDQIISKMIRFGAKLSSHERQVLGVFWSAASKENSASGAKTQTVNEDPLLEYRTVLENRCTNCHSLDRVEKAMMEGRSVEDLIEMMRQRGAIVTESDKSVLGTFWGQPFKQKSPK